MIGEFEFNFVGTKSLQYEALTHIDALRFFKLEYEKVMGDNRKARIIEKAKYLYDKFDWFKIMNENELRTLARYVKQRTFKTDHTVFYKGTQPEWVFIVKSGSFKIERYVVVEKKNIWPKTNRLWDMSKIKRNLLFTEKIIKQDQMFGVENLISGKPYEFNFVANNEGATLWYIEKHKILKLTDLNVLLEDIPFNHANSTLDSSVQFKWMDEDQIIEKIKSIEQAWNAEK